MGREDAYGGFEVFFCLPAKFSSDGVEVQPCKLTKLTFPFFLSLVRQTLRSNCQITLEGAFYLRPCTSTSNQLHFIWMHVSPVLVFLSFHGTSSQILSLCSSSPLSADQLRLFSLWCLLFFSFPPWSPKGNILHFIQIFSQSCMSQAPACSTSTAGEEK